MKRYRGDGPPHGDVEPPIVYEPARGKKANAPLRRGRSARPNEIPGG